MANFKDQIEGITGLKQTVTDLASDPELSDFLNDGVIDVTNRWVLTRPQDSEKFMRESATTSGNTSLNLNGAQIISVIREAGEDGDSDGSTAWRECRNIPISKQSMVVDTASLFYASQYNPVYAVETVGFINVYPVPTATNNGFRVFYINNSPEETDGTALDHASTGIKFFPKDKVYLVIIYASIKALENKMSKLTAVDEDAELVQAIAQSIVSLKNQYQSAFGAAPQEGK